MVSDARTMLERHLGQIMERGWSSRNQDSTWIFHDKSCKYAYLACVSAYTIIKDMRVHEPSPTDMKAVVQAMNSARKLRELELTDKIDEFVIFLEKILSEGIFNHIMSGLERESNFDSNRLLQYLVELELGTLEELTAKYQDWTVKRPA